MRVESDYSSLARIIVALDAHVLQVSAGCCISARNCFHRPSDSSISNRVPSWRDEPHVALSPDLGLFDMEQGRAREKEGNRARSRGVRSLGAVSGKSRFCPSRESLPPGANRFCKHQRRACEGPGLTTTIPTDAYSHHLCLSVLYLPSDLALLPPSFLISPQVRARSCSSSGDSLVRLQPLSLD